VGKTCTSQVLLGAGKEKIRVTDEQAPDEAVA
jgi:hypothetical protein